MGILNTILIDDNETDLFKLQNDVSTIPFVKTTGVFSQVTDALTFAQEHPTHLVISDIDMPKINGIEVIKNIVPKPLTIFISAHPQYALQSFDVAPLHYLLKPYTYEQLLKALHRAQQAHITKTTNPTASFIFVLANKQYIKINYSDILYIKADQNYVHIVTKSASYMVLHILTHFLNQLNDASFIRVHKSYAVNIQNITAYNTQEIFFDKTSIPLSQAYKENAFMILKNYTIHRA